MFDLESYLPYLINRVGARIALAYGKELRRHGMTLQMWRVLAALHQRDGQRIGELARMTSIDPSTLSRVIGAMQRKRLVERHRPPLAEPGGDARSVVVYSTAEGRAITQACIPLALAHEARALEGIGEAEAKMLKALLKRVHVNLEHNTRDDQPSAAA